MKIAACTGECDGVLLPHGNVLNPQSVLAEVGYLNWSELVLIAANAELAVLITSEHKEVAII